jgi:hypothetical protein
MLFLLFPLSEIQLKVIEPMTGFEPVTSSLPRKCSTTELHRQKSGRRDSNPRPSAWKANALSTELLPQDGEN